MAAIVAAVLSWRLRPQLEAHLFAYRAALFGAAALIAIAAHLGGTLVWGAAFLHP